MAPVAGAARIPGRSRVGWAAFFGLSVVLLWQGFASDRWNVADQRWFATFQRDTEALVIGRLVQSRQAGPFSYGGLLGYGAVPDPTASWDGFQFDTYFSEGSFAAFDPYLSQPGGQALLFVGLEKALEQPAVERYQMYQSLTALLTAAALSMVILWFGLEHGPVVAFFVLASALASGWLTVFGRHLFWSMWAFYAPLAASLYWVRREARRPVGRPIAFSGILFVAVAVKALLTGYEYMTTLVVMVLVPVVYYGWREQWGWRRTFVWLAAGTIGCLLAALATTALLTLQIAAVTGNLRAGVEHIQRAFARRTYGDEVAQAPVHEVLVTYLRGRFFDLNRFLSTSSRFVMMYVFKIRYLYLPPLFLIVSALTWFQRRGRGQDVAARRALVVAAWFSLAAPLSWYVVFRAHSQVHTHMNFIVWQMPFTLFGFAVVGLAASDLLAFLRRRFLPVRA